LILCICATLIEFIQYATLIEFIQYTTLFKVPKSKPKCAAYKKHPKQLDITSHYIQSSSS